MLLNLSKDRRGALRYKCDKAERHFREALSVGHPDWGISLHRWGELAQSLDEAEREVAQRIQACEGFEELEATAIESPGLVGSLLEDRDLHSNLEELMQSLKEVTAALKRPGGSCTGKLVSVDDPHLHHKVPN